MRKLNIFIFILFFNYVYSFDKYETLGNPYIEQYKGGEDIYSRNIWDMQYYEQKIYIGAGNGSNIGPSKNSGRVFSYSIDTQTDDIAKEFKVSEEQIDIFRVFDDKLYIPGYDATQNWKYGNFYIKNNNKWTKFRTIPKALHVYDIFLFEEKLFAGIGLSKGGGVAVSSNNGKSWEVIDFKSRIYSFMKMDNKLFALKSLKITNRNRFFISVLNEQGKFIPLYNVKPKDMFPNTSLKIKKQRLLKVESFDKYSLYIGAYVTKDYQTRPFGVYRSSIENNKVKANKINIPLGYTPRDILVRENKIYLLVTKKEKKYTLVKVVKFQSNNFDKYDEVLEFKSETFARSFEKSKTAFYFGLGTDVKDRRNWKQSELEPLTGTVLKVSCKDILLCQ